MEIHHHSHTSRKKWRHYFWEFLMLFLAVFSGFLAEYYLEHKIEHNREKQFIKALIKDIEADTAQLTRIKGFRLDRLKKMDSLQRFLSSGYKTTLPAHVYQLMENIKGHLSFYQNSGTLDQLKNAGGLRLIRKRKVVDSIQIYDQQIKRMLLRDNFEAEEMRYTIRLSYKLMDGMAVTKSFMETASPDLTDPNGTKSIPFNEEYLSEYLNSIVTYRYVVTTNLQLQGSIKNLGRELLLLLKKEYHLK